MFFSIAVWAMRVIEVLFFAGLFGCVLVIILSWASIFGDEIRRDDRQK